MSKFPSMTKINMSSSPTGGCAVSEWALCLQWIFFQSRAGTFSKLSFLALAVSLTSVGTFFFLGPGSGDSFVKVFRPEATLVCPLIHFVETFYGL